MKKLLLLTLFVCIGSIKMSSQVRISPNESRKVKFYENYKFYKNALGDKYDLFGNDDERIDRRNQIILEDRFMMIRENITEITFSPWLNIERIYSRDDAYKSEVTYDTNGFIVSRVYSTTTDWKHKAIYDSRDNFIEKFSKIKQLYMYENDFVPVEEFTTRNKLKKIICYDDRMIHNGDIYSDQKVVEDDREGGRSYAAGKSSIKKNGITKNWAGKMLVDIGEDEKRWIGHIVSSIEPEKEILYIQDVPILIKKNSKILKWKKGPGKSLIEDVYTYSKTEFEIVKEMFGRSLINEFDIKPMIELFLEDYRGFFEYYDMGYYRNIKIPYGNDDLKQKITATFEPLDGEYFSNVIWLWG